MCVCIPCPLSPERNYQPGNAPAINDSLVLRVS
jgi:hypothetical protein